MDETEEYVESPKQFRCSRGHEWLINKWTEEYTIDLRMGRQRCIFCEGEDLQAKYLPRRLPGYY